MLITNASLLHLPRVRRGLAILDASGGEIWAKLDAGTEDYLPAGQSLEPPIGGGFWTICGKRPRLGRSSSSRCFCGFAAAAGGAESRPTADRLEEILAAGGRIKLVQVHTIARQPSEAWASALSETELEEIAEAVGRCTRLPVASFP